MRKTAFSLLVIFLFCGVGTVFAQADNKPDPLVGTEYTVFYPGDSVLFGELDESLLSTNKQIVEKVVQLLKDNPYLAVRVVGHANPVDGTAKENTNMLIPLSRRRASELSRLLQFYGIAERRILTDGVGNRFALTGANDKDYGWMNRRVVFTIIRR
jgi:outer membrane protein OmpA-like peptidoglycan-associated protein